MKIAAPPVAGRANKELITFLGELISVRKDALAIIKGETSRSKVVAVAGLSQEEAVKRLLAHVLGYLPD